MVEVSVLITIYKESNTLEKNIKKLLSEKVEKEILVVIDEPTDKMEKIIKKYFNKVKFLVNRKRIGKVNALNKLLKLAKGKIILFLDGDVEVGNKNFLKNILEEIKDVDILDIKKEIVKENFLSKMLFYEYLSFNIGSFLFSYFIKSMPAINGAAFAIKKELVKKLKKFNKVYAEDIDFSLRAFFNNSKFKYTKKSFVKIYNNFSFYQFLEQRKRWYYGLAEVIKIYYKKLLKSLLLRKFHMLLLALIVLYPSLILLLLMLIFEKLIEFKTIVALLVIFLGRIEFLLSAIIFMILYSNFFNSLFLTLITFISAFIFNYVFSRKLDFKDFKVYEFFLYFFFYSISNFILLVSILFYSLALKRKIEIKNWKI